MRINFSNDALPKSIARRLKKLLSAQGIEIKLSKSLEATARLSGYMHWKELCGAIGAHPPTFMPSESGLEQLKAYQAEALSKHLQIGLPLASKIIGELQPTALSEEPGARGGIDGLMRRADFKMVLKEAAARLALAGDLLIHHVGGMDVGICYPLDPEVLHCPSDSVPFESIFIRPDGRLSSLVDVLSDSSAKKVLAAARQGDRNYGRLRDAALYALPNPDGDESALDGMLGRLTSTAFARPERAPANGAEAELTVRLARLIDPIDAETLAFLSARDLASLENYNLLVAPEEEDRLLSRFYREHPSFLMHYAPLGEDTGFHEDRFHDLLRGSDGDWPWALTSFALMENDPDREDQKRGRRLLKTVRNSRIFSFYIYDGLQFLSFLLRHPQLPLPTSEEELNAAADFQDQVWHTLAELGWQAWSPCAGDEIPGGDWEAATDLLQATDFSGKSVREAGRRLAICILAAGASLKGKTVTALTEALTPSKIRKASNDLDDLIFEGGVLGYANMINAMSEFFSGIGSAFLHPLNADNAVLRSAIKQARELAKLHIGMYDVDLGTRPSEWAVELRDAARDGREMERLADLQLAWLRKMRDGEAPL